MNTGISKDRMMKALVLMYGKARARELWDKEHPPEKNRPRFVSTKEDRRRAATCQYLDAVDLCEKRGLVLLRHSDVHYKLKSIRLGWMLEVYQGNQRIWTPQKKGRRAPYLELPRPWTLLDVVRAAVAAESAMFQNDHETCKTGAR